MNLQRAGFVVLLGSLFALVACTDEKKPVQQYGDAMVQTYKNAQQFEKKVNVLQVQKSIQEFYAANGRYPADLNELSAVSGLTLKTDNYDYDPATGTISEKR